MNSTQLKHALQRAATIYNKRYAEITEHFTVPAVVLDEEDKRLALLLGRFTVHGPEHTRYSRPAKAKMWYWLDIIDRYISFEGETPEKTKDGLFEAQATLSAAHERLKDLLHLGETSEALQLLDAFANPTALPTTKRKPKDI